MARYELIDGKSRKFWQIALDGSSFTTTFGRVDTDGQSKTKDFNSAEEARTAHDKVVRQKVKKGYVLVDGGAAPEGATAEPRPTPEKAEVASGGAQDVASVTSKDAARVVWSAALEERLAEARRDAIAEREAIDTSDAKTLYARINDLALELVKPGIENGNFRHPKHAALPKKVLWSYFAPQMPSSLDAEKEGVAMLLFSCVVAPPHHMIVKVPSREIALTMARFWLAHSGLPFAVRAWVHTLSPWCAVALNLDSSPTIVLHEAAEEALGDVVGPSGLPEERIARHGVLMLLQAAFARADDDTRKATMKVVEELGDDGHEVRRLGLAALTMNQPWLAEELATYDGRPQSVFRLSWDVLSVADPAALASVVPRLNQRTIESLLDHPYAVLELLERHRERALPVVEGFIARTVDALVDAPDHLHFGTLQRLRGLLELLDCVKDSSAFAEVLADLMTRLAHHKMARDEDVRIVALRYLNDMPVTALPAVRARSRSAWAKELLPQLERAAGAVELAPVAHESVIPPELAGCPFPKAPDFWDEAMLPQLVLEVGGALPAASVNRVGHALATEDRAVLEVVKTACTDVSLARFGWELFSRWESAGALPKFKWAMFALGHFGDDEIAQKLTTKIRKWPGESQHARATLGLDVLCEIGSDVALMCLSGVAQKVKYKALQRNARTKMDEIARRRGFTTEELEDRLVPDLELDADGSMEIDFGARSFRVLFDEAFKPFIVDARGKRRATLPKPGKRDDLDVAQPSVDRFKLLKKSVRTLASVQVSRLETAMGRRRWAVQDFDAFLVRHPLMVHLVRRLVWGVVEDREGQPHGGMVTTFRVAEDRTFADVDGQPLELASGAEVCLVHRLHLDDSLRAKWRTVMADCGLVPPFEQLDRDVFRLEEGDATETRITRFENRSVESKKLRGLVGRGWRHGAPQDNGMYHCFGRLIHGDVHAWLPIDSGLGVGYGDYDDDTQQLGAVTFGEDEPYGWGTTGEQERPIADIDPVLISEVLRDIESLGEVTGDA